MPPSPKPLTVEFRNRILMRCRDSFGPAGVLEEFWQQSHSKLAYLHGTPALANVRGFRQTGAAGEVIEFLSRCSESHFLDFVELIFRVEASDQIGDRDAFVEDVNHFLRVDDLPYALTPFVWTPTKIEQLGGVFDGMRLTSLPQIIARSSEVVHTTITVPVLILLQEPRFKEANAEFLEALADHRHRKYGDSLTKAGSAFESVLKVICATKGWSFRPSDTAAPLLKIVINEGQLEPFLEQPLLLVATMRNRLSTAHGAGSQPRSVSAAMSEYALNATASAILLLAKETS